MSRNEIESTNNSGESQSIFIRAWQGKERLVFVWWGFGIPLKIVTSVSTSAWALRSIYQGNETLLIFVSLLSLVAYAVLTVMAWRCAPNTKEKEWRWIARTALVLGWVWLIYQVMVESTSSAA
jgi:uncharacterized BrkB/YihY/UPF0761 family membrane protein